MLENSIPTPHALVSSTGASHDRFDLDVLSLLAIDKQLSSRKLVITDDARLRLARRQISNALELVKLGVSLPKATDSIAPTVPEAGSTS